MNRKILIFAAAFALLLVFATDALACGRCGLFGRNCRYAVHHKPHVAAHVAPVSQNFIFNNTFPPYLLAQGGNSVYGAQLSTAAYQDSPALYMDRAGRFAEQSLALATVANTGYQANAQLALQVTDAANRRQTNAMVALAAMQANNEPSHQALHVQIQNGQMQAQYVQPAAQTAPPATRPPQNLTTAQSCASCHDGRGEHGEPPGAILNGSAAISDRLLEKSIERIWSQDPAKVMPPRSNLTPQQRSIVAADLAKLLQTSGPAAPPDTEEVPPPPVNPHDDQLE